jgi:phosphomevalonate kinase
VLAGEYAVLDGAPAIVMAVDRRAVVRRRSSSGETGKAAPALATAVFDALGIDASPMELDSHAFYNAGSAGQAAKLGLGSSAALTVAMCRLLLPAASDAAQVCEAAVRAHRRFQGDTGSGVDVAASAYGGILRFTVGGDVTRLHWPAGLQFSAWWSGVPASTPEKLERLQRAGGSPAREQLAAAAGVLATGWATGDATVLMTLLGHYANALAAFDAVHDLGVFVAGHAELAAAAGGCGVVYKPCGAGGGDVGIALGTDRDALERFAVLAARHGFVRLDLGLDRRGAALDGAAS